MIERIIMKIHHARERGGEPQAVLDAAVAVQPQQRVTLRHVVQETALGKRCRLESPLS